MMQMLNKENAEELLRKAIVEIQETGTTSLDLIVNKKRQQMNPNMVLVEVGLRVEKSTKVPSTQNILRVKTTDSFLKVVDQYQEAVLATA